MIYYTENSKQVEIISKSFAISSGEQGYIHKLDDNKCIKSYIKGMPTIDPEIFKLYKELSLEGYSKLYDIFYRDPELQQVAGYTAKYYTEDPENLLFRSTEYTIYNLEVLYNAMKILSENQILVKDLIPRNIILGKDNVTVTDYDSCRLSAKNVEELTKQNIDSLMHLFKGLYKEAFKELAVNIEKNKELSNYINYFFSNGNEPIKKLQRKMKMAPRPIDFLYERC